MNEFAIAIMYVATLGFIGWAAWLYLQYRDLDKAIKSEILKMKQEISSLQMAQGLKQRAGPPWGPSPLP
jgi:hypothetical protein